MQKQQFDAKQQQSPEFSLNFWHRQLAHMLSLNSAELNDYIKAQAERNPCLEIETGHFCGSADDYQNASELIAEKSGNDFRRELEVQLHLKNGSVSPMERYIIASLDNHGYCRESIQELSALLKKTMQEVKQALRNVQMLEPPGVGARNLRECFLLQLARKGLRDSDPWVLLYEAFLPLSQGKDKAVLEQLGWTAKRLQNARNILAGLHPYPIEATEDTAAYVIPDAEIISGEDGGFSVQLYEHALPKLTISSSYLESLSAAGGGRRFSQDGIFYARRFIYCLQQRNQTLLKVLQFAVQRQQTFLSGGHRQVCLLKDAALQLGLHPSTITHAVDQKYLTFGRRLISAKELFARPVVGNYSADEFQYHLTQMIEQENKQSPYSDQRLADLLTEQLDTAVSRRTVAKYRLELKLADAKGRTKYDQKANDL